MNQAINIHYLFIFHLFWFFTLTSKLFGLLSFPSSLKINEGHNEMFSCFLLNIIVIDVLRIKLSLHKNKF